ncbi:MAG: type IV toxin-antitoxin system AbiEi family antitoxin domain-containing protein [Cyclobacteriaceae bacterium]|nr:type IV toxin-antitoxin system AbiEi family antitoxin domain-containing protein [Cyclobacteriaceae bacterium]
MNGTIENKVIYKIKKAKRGSLFFTEDFLRFGSAKAIAKALERLCDKKEIIRVARGIYTRPQIDTLIGEVKPGTEAIAQAIAKRDKARVIPTGVWALNALGLSTQVPMNVVYLTDGAARKIDLGKRKITFKKTTPKNLAHLGKVSGLAIQALKEIGKDNATEEEKQKIIELLKTKEDPYRLEHDIRLAPEWIRVIMRQALNASN